MADGDVRPAHQNQSDSLQSARFAGQTPFEETLAGARKLKWGNCNGGTTATLQGALGDLGHDPGGADGIWGPKTNGALLNFQKASALVGDGVIGPLTMRTLDSADAAAGGGQGKGKGDDGADPRLEHKAVQVGDDKVDPEAEKGRSINLLPYKGAIYSGSEGGWKGVQIVSQWSQLDENPTTNTDQSRCAANATIVPRILAGPIAFADYADALFAASKQVLAKTKTDNDYRAEMVAKSFALGLVSAQVRMRIATWGTLDLVADCAKLFMTNDPGGATSGHESGKMQQLAADKLTTRNKTPGSLAEVDELCDELTPGESWLVQVDTNVLKHGEAKDVGQVDHFVTIGKRGDEVYLYDPWPRAGSQMIWRKDKPGDFTDYFINAHGDMKYSEFLSRTSPRRH